MMRKFIAKIISPFLQYFVKHYFVKPRTYRYKKIKIKVLPGVFFPHFTLSTKLLLQFLETKELHKKTFLELGCGTGIISVFAAQKGAETTATDINPKAIENVTLNAKTNHVKVLSILSDLFTAIPQQQFNYIIINPPYYPKKPKNKAEEAWFCGENFEYFEKLFASITPYFNSTSEVYMILSEDCNVERIKSIAFKNKLLFTTILEKRKYREMNYIYCINKK
ncbi:MAG: methyltransferase [Vicingaceae bacterium]